MPQKFVRIRYQNKDVIMCVFLSVSNINSIMNPDGVPKNRCGRWRGNKELINVGLMLNLTKMSL